MMSPKKPLTEGILHRVVAATLAAICAVAAGAQQPRKASSGPRALGLLVVPKAPAGAKKPAQPYLIPIDLWYQNRYFDAQLYGARPQPMALDGGVVYEARRGGEALGLFTVESIAQLENKHWIGGGTYQTMKEIETRAAARRERNKGPTEDVKDEGPPRLRRSDRNPSPAPATPAPTPASAPTASVPAPPPPAQTAPATPPAPAPSTAETKPAPKPSEDEDPDRPRLHRAPGGEAQTIAPAIKPGPTQLALPPKSTPAVRASMPEVMVAISDERTSEPRPYEFHWSPEEKETYTKAVEQMAEGAIGEFLQRWYKAAPPQPRPATTQRSRTRAAQPPAPPAPPLENVQVQALDVQTDNYPELVFTAQRAAQVPAPDGGSSERTLYVTMVVKVDTAAVDRRDQFRSVLSYVTDDRHLDELPRLELIDAVDADGDGIGELLFREIFSAADENNPQAWGFQLFRVGPDRLEKLYDSEGKME